MPASSSSLAITRPDLSTTTSTSGDALVWPEGSASVFFQVAPPSVE